jgi:ATP-binding cassette, subfamily B, bacterial CvaB/MchF/RaxB
LARALYRNPKILILDEGTANLDLANEAAIADVVQAMPITRIVIAHRPTLIERADRVVYVTKGQLGEPLSVVQSSHTADCDLKKPRPSISI